MKKSITILVAFISLNAFGQIPMDAATKKFVYEAIVKVDSIKTEVIYNNAKEWIVRNLKSSDNNMSFDKESKTITSTGNMHLEDRGGLCLYKEFNLNFKFSVFIKEGRYKYIIENFYISYYKDCSQGKISPVSGAFENLDIGKKQNEKVFNEADIKFKSMISDLEKYIKSSPAINKSDW
jgi:hypothetical protein